MKIYVIWSPLHFNHETCASSNINVELYIHTYIHIYIHMYVCMIMCMSLYLYCIYTLRSHTVKAIASPGHCALHRWRWDPQAGREVWGRRQETSVSWLDL